MISKLPMWNVPETAPAFYDSESVTAIQATAKLHGKMNELIEDYNKFATECNKKIDEFQGETKEELEVFETAMRQEFQDFIDIVTLKYERGNESFDKKLEKSLLLIESGNQSFVEKLAESLSTIESEKQQMLEEIEAVTGIVQTTGDSQTAVMSQNAVTQELNTINEEIYFRTINKYDPSIQTPETISPHYYVNGAPYSTTDFDNKFNCTALIPVKPSTQYSVGLVPSTVGENGNKPWRDSSSGLFQYDENGNYIVGTSTSNNTFVTTDSTRYIRFNYSIANNVVTLDELNSRCVLVEGENLPSEFIPYENDSVKNTVRRIREKLQNKADIDSTVLFPIRYIIDGDKIDIISKLNSNFDGVVKLMKKGGNNLFDIFGFGIIPNQSPVISESLEGFTSVIASDSDWFAPFKVSAVENIDGDNISSAHFTGGNHQYNNTGAGSSPTARTTSLQFFADNKEAEGSGSCNEIKIKWTNRVQAYNTKKEDGTGREVIEEIHTLIFDGNKLKCEVELNPLEDINIERWYGFQGFGAKSVFKNIKYVGGTNREIYDGSIADTSSGNKDPNKIVAYGDNYSLSIGIDRTYDLGKCLLSNSIKGIFTDRTTGKIYCDIINPYGLPSGVTTVLHTGNRYYLRGFYKFDSVKNMND